MWEAVETSVRKVGMGKAEGRRGKEGSREKERRKGEEEEGKANGSEESSRRMRDIGCGGRSGKVGRGSQEVGTREVSQMD